MALISTNEEFFLRAGAKEVIASHVNASSVYRTLIDNGKLANQIARLAAIVAKSNFLKTCALQTCAVFPYKELNREIQSLKVI